MKAIIHERYGHARLADIDRPSGGSLLVRVRAASVNPYDWHSFTGTPYFLRLQAGLLRPRDRGLGLDYAGVVESVGPDVTGFAPGDEVFGTRDGSFAEYVSVTGNVAHKPSSISFEEAAAAPLAAVTALQGLRSLRSGQDVLVIGAGGGIGTFAVQLAAARGAVVTGVCSARNVDLVRSLGAKHVVDYTRAEPSGRYDLILDNVGTLPLRRRLALLKPDGRLVVVSGPKTNRLLGPIPQMILVMVAARLRKAPATVLMTRMNTGDLLAVADLLAAGTIVSVIDRRQPLAEAPDALRHIGTGHARGKVVITV
jgi:NADPH:quinone reductase-like Zn-dependent oxidoreductase